MTEIVEKQCQKQTEKLMETKLLWYSQALQYEGLNNEKGFRANFCIIAYA